MRTSRFLSSPTFVVLGLPFMGSQLNAGTINFDPGTTVTTPSVAPAYAVTDLVGMSVRARFLDSTSETVTFSLEPGPLTIARGTDWKVSVTGSSDTYGAVWQLESNVQDFHALIGLDLYGLTAGQTLAFDFTENETTVHEIDAFDGTPNSYLGREFAVTYANDPYYLTNWTATYRDLVKLVGHPFYGDLYANFSLDLAIGMSVSDIIEFRLDTDPINVVPEANSVVMISLAAAAWLECWRRRRKAALRI